MSTTRRRRKLTEGDSVPRRFTNKAWVPTRKHFRLAELALALGLTMFDLAERIGLNRRAGYPWNKGALVNPDDPKSEVKPYVPESSYAAAREYLKGYARDVKGAADALLALEEEGTPPDLSQPIASQDMLDSAGGNTVTP